ncbi:unnamed protein product [Rotaria sp. Silwood1]|nr:unnamed protein product [Rotaria sp. Silwood1]CAF1635068.1 unnamed protein product [Rotaria sp. Silwood1]
MQTRSTLDTSSNNLFTNIERLGTRDLLSYGQLSYDTILTSIQNNNLAQKNLSISLERLLIVGQYPKNDIWRLYDIRAPLLLLRPLSLLLAHISLSNRLMNKMVLEFVASTQKLYSQILAYTVFAFLRALINARYSAKVNE